MGRQPPRRCGGVVVRRDRRTRGSLWWELPCSVMPPGCIHRAERVFWGGGGAQRHGARMGFRGRLAAAWRGRFGGAGALRRSAAAPWAHAGRPRVLGGRKSLQNRKRAEKRVLALYSYFFSEIQSHGAVAQMVERPLSMREVPSSILGSSSCSFCPGAEAEAEPITGVASR